MRRQILLIACTGLALALIAGCGATLTAVGVLIAESGGSSSGGSNSLPAASMTSPTGTQAGDITLSYNLIDAEGNPVDISIAYTFDGTDFFETSEAPIAPSEGRMALATSPTGSPHTFLWNTYWDLPAAGPLTVKLRITPYDSLTGIQGEWSLSESFTLNNKYMASVYEFKASAEAFSLPAGAAAVVYDGSYRFYIADRGRHKILLLDGLTGTVEDVAGTGNPGYNGDNIPAELAQLNNPFDVALDAEGNIYVADAGNSRIRRIDHETKYITTVAGSGLFGYGGDGDIPTRALLAAPVGITLDGSGNLYIADTFNHLIRVVNRTADPFTVGDVAIGAGTIETVAGTLEPGINQIGGESINGSGTSGNITLMIGDGGPAVQAALNMPTGIELFMDRHIVFADSLHNRVRALNANPTGGATVTICGIPIEPTQIQTIAGGALKEKIELPGPATALKLALPNGISFDGGDNLYLADSGNHRILKVDPGNKCFLAAGTSRTGGFKGDGGDATDALLFVPRNVVTDGAGNFYVSDTENGRFRAVNTTGSPIRVAGVSIDPDHIDSIPAPASTTRVERFLSSPTDLVTLGATYVYVSDAAKSLVVQLDLVNRTTTILAGDGTDLGDFRLGGTEATSVLLFDPEGLFLDTRDLLYIADTGNSQIRVVNLGDVSRIFYQGSATPVWVDPGKLVTIAGSGSPPTSATEIGDGGHALEAHLSLPHEIFATNQALYIADTGNQRIRRIGFVDGICQTVAGTAMAGFAPDGTDATEALLWNPIGLHVDASGVIIFADTGNHLLRRMENGKVYTVAGLVDPVSGPGAGGYNGDNIHPLSALLNTPTHLLLDATGDIYFSDTGNHLVRKIDRTADRIYDVCGTANPGYNGDGLPPENAQLNQPRGIGFDLFGSIYVADQANIRVRRFYPRRP
jgi:sugar lactone lactonase YvrE